MEIDAEEPPGTSPPSIPARIPSELLVTEAGNSSIVVVATPSIDLVVSTSENEALVASTQAETAIVLRQTETAIVLRQFETMVDPLQSEAMVALPPTETTTLSIRSEQKALEEIRETTSESETAIVVRQPDNANNLPMTFVPTEAMSISSTAVTLGKRKCDEDEDEAEAEDEDAGDMDLQIRKTDELKKTKTRKIDDNSELDFFSLQQYRRHT
jgi:hypothetical protein